MANVRGNAWRRRGSTLPDKLDLLWTYTVGKGAFESTPVIANGIVYIGDLDGHFFAIDLATGKEKWKTKQEAGFNASAAFRDGRCTSATSTACSTASMPRTASEKWHQRREAEINSAPNFYKENVLFGSQDGTLYCLDATTGKEAWKYQIEDQIRCSPTIVEGRAFLAGCDGKLHIIDVDKGEAIGSVPIESPTGSTPAVLGRSRLLRHRGRRLFAVNWRQEDRRLEVSRPSRASCRFDPRPPSPARPSYFGGHDKQSMPSIPRRPSRLEVSDSRPNQLLAGGRRASASTSDRRWPTCTV